MPGYAPWRPAVAIDPLGFAPDAVDKGKFALNNGRRKAKIMVVYHICMYIYIYMYTRIYIIYIYYTYNMYMYTAVYIYICNEANNNYRIWVGPRIMAGANDNFIPIRF